MADQFYDKLGIPPVPPPNNPHDLKLTLTTIEKKKKLINDQLQESVDINKENNNKLKKIQNFIKLIKNQYDDRKVLNENLKNSLIEIDNFKNNIEKLKLDPKEARKQIDGLVEDVETSLKSHQEFVSKIDQLAGASEKKISLTEKLATGISNTWNVVKNVASKLYETSLSIKRSGIGSVFCNFWDKTLVRFFNVSAKNGNLLINFLSKISKGVAVVFGWIKEKGIGAIEFMYNTFKKLSLIGWKALTTIFTAITYPIKLVGGFFADTFSDIISTPLGFLAVAALVGTGVYFLSKPLVNFIKNILSGAWDWIVNSFDEFRDNHPQLFAKFGSATDTILGWVKSGWKYLITEGRLENAYNNTIGYATGLTTDRLDDIVNIGIGWIQKAWSFVTDIFTSLYENGTFDELLLLWQAIKSIIISDENIIRSNRFSENRERLSAGLMNSLTEEAQALIQGDILNVFFKKYGGIKTPEAVKELTERAGFLLSNFLRSRIVTTDKKRNKEILMGVDIQPYKLVQDILSYSQDTQENLLASAKLRKLSFSEKANKLGNIDMYREDETTDITLALDNLLGKNANKLNTKLLNNSNQYPFEDTDEIIQLEKHSAISDSQQNSKISKNFIPEAIGGIIRRPVYALIGEGQSPEMVIPLNKDGLEFVYNSMKDFILSNVYDDVSPSTPTSRDVVRRIQKNRMTKPDTKTYDMKNLSTGVVGFR